MYDKLFIIINEYDEFYVGSNCWSNQLGKAKVYTSYAQVKKQLERPSFQSVRAYAYTIKMELLEPYREDR